MLGNEIGNRNQDSKLLIVNFSFFQPPKTVLRSRRFAEAAHKTAGRQKRSCCYGRANSARNMAGACLPAPAGTPWWTAETAPHAQVTIDIISRLWRVHRTFHNATK